MAVCRHVCVLGTKLILSTNAWFRLIHVIKTKLFQNIQLGKMGHFLKLKYWNWKINCNSISCLSVAAEHNYFYFLRIRSKLPRAAAKQRVKHMGGTRRLEGPVSALLCLKKHPMKDEAFTSPECTSALGFFALLFFERE